MGLGVRQGWVKSGEEGKCLPCAGVLLCGRGNLQHHELSLCRSASWAINDWCHLVLQPVALWVGQGQSSLGAQQGGAVVVGH